MFILAGIFYAITLSLGSTISANLYDAPIPDRCATFDQRYDSTNGNTEFCRAWFKEHRVKDEARAPQAGG